MEADFFNIAECLMRVNVVGIGRFTISLYGEANREMLRLSVQNELAFIQRERIIVSYYIEGLKQLANVYDDTTLLTFIEDFQNSEMYIEAFRKTVKLAEIRKVPENEILKTKSDIDLFFQGGSNK